MIMQQVSAFSVKLAGKKVCDINVIGFCKAHNIIVVIRLKRWETPVATIFSFKFNISSF